MLTHRLMRQNEILPYELSSQILHLGILKLCRLTKHRPLDKNYHSARLPDYYPANNMGHSVLIKIIITKFACLILKNNIY